MVDRWFVMQTSPHGVLIIDKPSGITSRGALNRVAGWFPPRTRIGHAGTLDPLATGVLVICVGVATRLIEYVQDMRKTYAAEFRLGATSDTDDADGTVVPGASRLVPTADAIAKALDDFLGVIEQRPPVFSAAKVSGRRAHALARRGEEVKLQPRKVQIHSIRVVDYHYPALQVEVQCGKGTYIRALARDLGTKLQCGALVQALRRTQVGPFSAQQGVTLDFDAASVLLMPPGATVVELRTVMLTDDEIRSLKLGQQIPMREELRDEPTQAAAFDSKNELVAIVKAEPAARVWKPEKVLVI
jgi:tRNA pseudouridine55 synthase